MCAGTIVRAGGQCQDPRVNVERIRVDGGGIRQNVLVGGAPDGVPVLLVHGNCCSGGYWLPLLRHLPDSVRVVAPDLRGYGLTEPAPVDATRGLGDFADDVARLLDEPRLWAGAAAGVRPVVVGHSIGGGVAMRLAVDHPDRVAGLMLEAPVSPYGFGGTRDVSGTPTTPDFAGTGGGSVSPDFVGRLASGDRGADGPTSPRAVLRTAYVADPASLGADEEALLDTVLSTVVGEDNYPGDGTDSPHWPGSAPGSRGVINAISPRWFHLADELVGLAEKPPVVWVRGDADVIVSDTSLFDLAYLGKLGVVPGWPGDDECPPQPMVAQTRAVLDRYAAAGGAYTEIVYDNCGHSPHVERPAAFAEALVKLVTSVS
jgi:pimeloyl-ACP methyl ester carboxylesterase